VSDHDTIAAPARAATVAHKCARFLPIDDTAWWATGYTLAGWALAAMLIAGLAGVFRRQ